MSPQVSVIMAVHNGEAYLHSAVDSILSQTLSSLELVIVDDASTDATAEVLARYNDPRMRLLRNQRRLGPGAARNRGLRIARAPLIAIQDADDSSLPDRLKTQVEFFAENRSLAVAGAYAIAINADGREGGIMKYPPAGDLEIKWALLFWNPFIHSSIMVRRSVLEEGGGYAEEGELRWLAEDYELLSRIGQRYRTANITRPLVRYRSNPAGASVRLEDLQRASEEVSRRNVSWLLAGDAFDVETYRSLRGFWCEAKSLLPAEARRALAANKLLLQAFLSHYAEPGIDRPARSRFYRVCARRAFQQAWRNSHLEPRCRAAILFSTMALALKGMA